MKVGQILLQDGREIKLKAVARSLDVSVRTLKNWKRMARDGASGSKARPGRPRHSQEAHRKALWGVGRELRKQRYPGWRSISRALQGQVPTRLVQLYVSRLKKRRKVRVAARLEKERIRVEVLARDVIWGQDGSHLGRTIDEQAVESQVIRDRGSHAFVAIESGPPADHGNVLRLLKRGAVIRGGYPLVYARDNGSMYAHEAVERFMEEQKIIVLRSLPRTPQHNGATERAIRELKDATGLGKGVRVASVESAQALVEIAATALNANRLRPSKGFKTANELDDTLPVGYNCDRDLFYRECRANMERAVQESQTARAARMAEREAVFVTLEKFGLIRRSRGGESHVQKREIFL